MKLLRKIPLQPLISYPSCSNRLLTTDRKGWLRGGLGKTSNTQLSNVLCISILGTIPIRKWTSSSEKVTMKRYRQSLESSRSSFSSTTRKSLQESSRL